MNRKLKIKRINVRDGYNQWSKIYDTTPNPLIALDQQHTINILKPKKDELILDAGCGTGRNLNYLLCTKSQPIGIDFSFGMLNIAQRHFPSIPLAQADLNHELPLIQNSFDAVLCALVGEHLTNLYITFKEIFRSLKESGRFIFSVFHPEMAASGIEANFTQNNVEYRLGAEKHTVDDYVNIIEDVGFSKLQYSEFEVDKELVNEIPKAAKYIGYPLLLVITAYRN